MNKLRQIIFTGKMELERYGFEVKDEPEKFQESIDEALCRKELKRGEKDGRNG